MCKATIDLVSPNGVPITLEVSNDDEQQTIIGMLDRAEKIGLYFSSRGWNFAHGEGVGPSAHELAEIRLLDAVLTGEATLSVEEAGEVERIVGDGSPLQRLGLGEGAPIGDAQATAAERATYWKERAESPLLMPFERDLLGIAARSYEGIYSELSQAPG